MDQKLLESLGNLSLALEEIATALKDKSEAQSATAKAMKGGDFIKEIKEINKGVIQLQKDTKQILANQQTIMKMGSQKKQETEAERLGSDKKSQNNFKDGIKVILLIAVAVLAIGAAFLLIGKVNFLSVIALSIALPLLAIGFAKVHTTLKKVGFNPKTDAAMFIIAVTSIAVGIMLSSYILSMITPLSFAKFTTATFIALMFALLAPSIMKFMMAFKEMSWMQLIKSVVGFPLILPAIALGIAFASWALQLIKPISFTQFLTAVGIGIVFAIISFGIRKMLKSFDGLNIADLAKAVLFLPLILPAIALGIALSSYAFQLIKPIGFMQFISAVGIALVFAVVAFGIRKLLKSFEGLSPGTIVAASLMLPILLVAVSYAIAYSSMAFQKIVPVKFSQFLTAIGIAAVFVVISFGIKQIVKGVSDMDWKSVPKIPVLFVLVSIAIMASSWILSLTKPLTGAQMKNILIVGVTLAAIALIMSFPIKILAKISIKDLLMGTLGVVVVAVAVMVSSLILSLGSYKKYPDWKWALGVALSMVAFLPPILILGAIAMSGVGALAVLAGAGMVLLVAATITAASYILGAGKYGNYPPVAWSASVAISMAAFTVGMVALGALVFATFGIGGAMLAAGSEAVLNVADTIVKASFILDKGKYEGGPTLAWAGGIALALAAFSPIYAMLMANGVMKIFGGGGIGPDDFSNAIKTVSLGIVTAAGYFAENKAAFVNGPPKAWAEGVGLALGAFSPVYKMLMNNGVMKIFGGGGVGPGDFATAIKTVSQGIIDAAWMFAGNTAPFAEGSYPSKKWGEGVGAALGAFAPVFKSLSEDTGWFTSGDDVINNMKNAVVIIAGSLVDAAKKFATAKNAWSAYPSKDWADGVKLAIVSFLDLFKEIEDRGFTMFTFKMYSNVLSGALQSIATSAKTLWMNQKFFSFKMNPTYIADLSKNVLGYAALSKALDKALTTEEKKTISLGFIGEVSYTTKKKTEVSNINKVVSQMVITAGILYKNRKFFEQKIDPNFMSRVAKNILTFADLANQLASKQKGQSKFDELIGMDPISRAANGMVKIANAYDTLAKAVRNFSNAINGLNTVKLYQFRMLTGNLAMLSAMDSGMFSNMLKVLESRAGVFAKLIDIQERRQLANMPQVKVGGTGGAPGAAIESKKGGVERDAKGETSLQKLDRIATLLAGINRHVDTIDMILQNPKAKNEEIGKGDG